MAILKFEWNIPTLHVCHKNVPNLQSFFKMPHVRQNNTQIKMCCCRQKIKMIVIGEIIKIVISKLFYPYRFKGHTVRYDQTWFFWFYSCPKPVQIQWLLNMFLYVKYSGLYTAQWLCQLKCIAAVRERFLTSQTTQEEEKVPQRCDWSLKALIIKLLSLPANLGLKWIAFS